MTRLYQWSARNKNGNTYNGEIMAVDNNDVAVFIKSKYDYVTNIKPKSTWFNPKECFHRNSLSAKEKEIFFRQLSTLLNSGIPLIKAVGILKVKVKDNLRELCRYIEQSLLEGLSFSKALDKFPCYFSSPIRKSVSAGEVSGNLINAFLEIADLYKQEENTFKSIRHACIYPCIILAFSCATLVFFLLKVMPLCASIYGSSNIAPYSLLGLMLRGSSLLVEHPFKCAAGFLFLPILLYTHKKALTTFTIKLPYIKNCYKNFAEERFCKLLGLMLKSGIALPLALLAAGETLPTKDLRNSGKILSKDVLKGIPLSKAVELRGNIFSSTTVEFINIGEHSGSLADMLISASFQLNKEVQSKIKELQILLEPAMMLMTAAFVGIMIVAVTSPLFGLVTTLPEYQ